MTPIDAAMPVNRRQLVTKVVLDALGFDAGMEEFDTRLRKQKLMVTLAHAGMDVGYRFKWHKNGPYSTELSSDLFDLARKAGTAHEPPAVASDELQARLKAIRAAIGESITDPLFMETLGSIAFIEAEFNLTESNDLIDRLIQLKPHIERDGATAALLTWQGLKALQTPIVA